MVVKEKAHKKCSSCETKYTVVWDKEEQDLDPWTCPFCGFEVEHEDDEEEQHDFENCEENEDDSWN